MPETSPTATAEHPTPRLTLQRLVVEDFGALGVLKTSTANGEPERILTCTLERTYRTAADAGVAQRYERPAGPQFVKVQHGLWTCQRSWFARGGYRTFEVMAPGHSQIKFHKGAIEEHSEGCILLGMAFTPSGISLSTDALARFLHYTLGFPSFLLEVRT